MLVLAGIVTYNPNIELLQRNIASVLKQIDFLVIVDNCSDNRYEISRFQDDRVHIINNDNNLGVAHALNQELYFAFEKGYEWVLTLDQDTIIPDNLLSEYEPYSKQNDVGMLTCRIQDRNLDQHNDQPMNDYDYVSVTITSGALLRVNAWKTVNGFCEEMFIDSVDHDMCLSLLEHRYKIIRINSVILNHAVGRSSFIISFGKRYQIYNESPLRNYYQFRNSIYLLKRHRRLVLDSYRCGLLGFIFSRVNRAYLICRYEVHPFQKLHMIVMGVWHGIIGKYGKYN